MLIYFKNIGIDPSSSTRGRLLTTYVHLEVQGPKKTSLYGTSVNETSRVKTETQVRYDMSDVTRLEAKRLSMKDCTHAREVQRCRQCLMRK